MKLIVVPQLHEYCFRKLAKPVSNITWKYNLPTTLMDYKNFGHIVSRDDSWADASRENDVWVVLEAIWLNKPDNIPRSFLDEHFCNVGWDPIFLVCGIYMLDRYRTHQSWTGPCEPSDPLQTCHVFYILEDIFCIALQIPFQSLIEANPEYLLV